MKKMNRIYALGRRVGLNKKDIDNITNSNKKLEQVNFSYGPYEYHGGRYGTVSVKDFY